MRLGELLRERGIDTGGRAAGSVNLTCPECSAGRKPEHRRTKVLKVWFTRGQQGDPMATWKCAHCGFHGSVVESEKKPMPSDNKPTPPPRKVTYESAGLNPAVLEWFAARGITQPVLERNRIGFGRAFVTGSEQGAIRFPYFDGAGVVNIKHRTREKGFALERGAELCLYGLNDIRPGEDLIWVEGEIDKLSLEVAGFQNVVSPPNGAQVTKSGDGLAYLKRDEGRIAQVSRHIIAGDADAPGEAWTAELIRRLGPEKCLRVAWPAGCKDANDVLLKFGPERIKECVESATPLPIAGLVEVSDIDGDILELYRSGLKPGLSPGSESLSQFYSIVPGQWTLVTGIPAHGKSAVVDWMMVNLASLHDWRFLVCSPENQPLSLHFSKWAEIWTGQPFGAGPTQRMSEAQLREAMLWAQEHFVFEMPEEWTVDHLLEVARRAVLRYGINGVVLDPWNEFDHARDGGLREDEYLKDALIKVRRFARLYNVHVWIVAHPKTLQKDKEGVYPVPTPYDVSGGSMWRNKADMCLSVWRDESDESSAVQIHVQKVRFKHCGKVGMCELYYDRVTGRYQDTGPYRFTGYEPDEEANRRALESM